jgi:hypothetical protein
MPNATSSPTAIRDVERDLDFDRDVERDLECDWRVLTNGQSVLTNS